MELMLHEENPLFERYSAESDVWFHEYLKLSLSALISNINNDHSLIFDRLHSLSHVQLNRKGEHAKIWVIKNLSMC
jgi:hypothetical protein